MQKKKSAKTSDLASVTIKLDENYERSHFSPEAPSTGALKCPKEVADAQKQRIGQLVKPPQGGSPEQCFVSSFQDECTKDFEAEVQRKAAMLRQLAPSLDGKETGIFTARNSGAIAEFLEKETGIFEDWTKRKPKRQASDASGLPEHPGLTDHTIFKRQGRLGGNLLITGETGTGKHLLAETIARRVIEDPKQSAVEGFEHIQCSNLPEQLLESELFGHMRGAFTHAVYTKPGRLLFAFGKVAFLDEVGDMPMTLQGKLLQFVQERTIAPMAYTGRPLCCPLTLIAATNKHLPDQIDANRFREDLYFRFQFQVNIPPLRERKKDIPYLADYILQDPNVNPKQGHYLIRSIHAEAIEKLQGYDFPGNVRELEAILFGAVHSALLNGRNIIAPEDVAFPRESLLPEQDSSIVILKFKVNGKEKYLLTWNVTWRGAFFVGGRATDEKGDRSAKDTIIRKIEEELALESGVDYEVSELVLKDEVRLIQYSRTRKRLRLYNFAVYELRGLKDAAKSKVDALLDEGGRRTDVILLTEEELKKSECVDREGKERPISPSLRKVLEKLGPGFLEGLTAVHVP